MGKPTAFSSRKTILNSRCGLYGPFKTYQLLKNSKQTILRTPDKKVFNAR